MVSTRFALAVEVNRLAQASGAFPHVLLEVNVAGESTKFGFSPKTLEAQVEELLALDRLAIDGLMCLPPTRSASGGREKILRRLADAP
jgi:uncharacterized pyridoxal phosphate-containing UPF0001 family protein